MLDPCPTKGNTYFSCMTLLMYIPNILVIIIITLVSLGRATKLTVYTHFPTCYFKAAILYLV